MDLTAPSICPRVAPVLVDGYDSSLLRFLCTHTKIELQVDHFNYGPTTKIDQDDSREGGFRRVEGPRVQKGKAHEAPAYSLRTCRRPGTG